MAFYDGKIKIMTFSLMAIALLLSPFEAHAQAKVFAVSKATFQLAISNGWEVDPKAGPASANFLGKENADKLKPSVSVSFVRSKGTKLPENFLNQKLVEYFESKQRRLRSRKGAVITTEPLRSAKLTKVTEAQRLGVTYREGAAEWHETSYFVSCEGKVFHVKALDPKSSGGRSARSSADQLAKTFACPAS